MSAPVPGDVSGPGSAGGGAARSDGVLEQLFAEHWNGLEGPGSDELAIVGVSGGVDSVVLLHLLRFGLVDGGPRLLVAHFDHDMRAGSGGDAAWVRGLAQGWRLDSVEERAHTPLESEEQARAARYAFLHRVREDTGASAILTAHHADDQAETVLFRILRGTGLRGLTGIHERRTDGVLRPLLPFWKAQIQAYARAHRIQPRIDPSNRSRAFARNHIRHDVLPRLERETEPAVRRALIRLSALARQNEQGWEDLLPEVFERIQTVTEMGETSISRTQLLSYDPAVQARVLRALAERHEVGLDGASTRAMLDFVQRGGSGRTLRLPGGLALERAFETLVFSRIGPDGPESSVAIYRPGAGWGIMASGGKGYRVRWALEARPSGAWSTRFHSAHLGFPLSVRAWRPGDRMELSFGTKKVRRLFAEAGVSATDRRRRPVLADASGRVLWVPGVARSSAGGTEDGDFHFAVGVVDADQP